MVANQKSQQDIYNKLDRANKDNANEAIFAAIETYDGVTEEKIWRVDRWADQACRISRHDFWTEIIKKSIRAVC